MSELKHWGTKGMRWGVRKNPQKTSSKKSTAKNIGKGALSLALGMPRGENSTVEPKNLTKGQRIVRRAIRLSMMAPKERTSIKPMKSEEEISKVLNRILGFGLITQSDYSEDTLKHWGIKGMRWGVRRNRNRLGGADGKEESVKVADKRGKVQKHLDSFSRERQWRRVLKEVDKMSTKEIGIVSSRISLENKLKSLSKTKGVGNKKDKEDYLRRANMSDAELKRKVVRLQAKKSLHENITSASKEQIEFGQKIVQVGGSVGVKYALNRGNITPKDLFMEAAKARKTPKDSFDKAQEELVNEVKGRKGDAAGYILNYVINSTKPKPKSKS